jgi:crotonobetainyl-CoA:carnitine CoA-transferase CaiB-like acyl-CoA transferase
MKSLKYIKILDFTRLLPGPLATNQLADLGAEVIKIERAGHEDYVKNQAPFINGISTLYYALNSNKTIKIFDFDSENDFGLIKNLISESDILIEQYRPGTMKIWKLDYENVKKINPNIIYISLTGYGQTGAYSLEAGHDINYIAQSGLLDLNRDDSGRPVIPNFQIADIFGGSLMLQNACLAALLERNNSYSGQHIDLSMTHSLMPLLSFPMSQLWGGFDQRELKILNGGLVNYNIYKCKDEKWVVLGALELKFWNKFCLEVSKSEWVADNIFDLSIHVFPVSEMEELFLSRDRDEWSSWALGKNICLSPVLELDEIEKHDLFTENRMIELEEQSNSNALKTIRNYFKD